MKAIIIGCGIAGPAMALALQKIGVQAVIYEAREAADDTQGAFLGISPNGLNILREYVALEEVMADSTPGKIRFFNARNKAIGVIDNAEQASRYGSETIQVKRGLLNGSLRRAAERAGIAIEFGKRLVAIGQREGTVTVSFADGSTAEGDLLIGCDGIHSAVRRAVFPNAPEPQYTGLLSTGGFTRPDFAVPADSIRMTFGERGFFGYAVSTHGEVWWFNNIAQKTAPQRHELNQSELADLKKRLVALHRNDPEPIVPIIERAHSIEIYPIYDIPFLDQWHQGGVCLIGDAAHATAPHIGQGASLALEDTLVLAQCIRDCADLQAAFARFQSLRQARVQAIIRQARKVGDTKTVPNRFQQFFRDLLLPFFVKLEARKMDWVYGYRVDWHKKLI
ncbi:2-polyprenyl-6-methoxyphenol hydroxylase-like FAD-dependent oxidoreductase [Dyadobacter sp. BE34]|uniref:2-polyprenyl-6-methoxyphenol hydroxylase-like FAD-dependent oxidoreductase n=1 Tax=Dyadobacter fermentans TaxID=94254 RepID=A0ABU1QUR5_9BACT|nr:MULTISPECIES: FAD-dependent monooxygenase [Dyadobacter]MDR6804884.1 2-polyprenyl-6-methoxyphenol hydroxylase-like FAD-dependent oxidoreductase [Dyadobacter fermentans]MDR7043357.1 2-polyprenyl-6-methoxyphenol hydroxylase-like FAD-dependent oxidoreductase [Dyadobacter sp. BE242]MDR7197669.1 2-polyprenyl-6-methoxyphenol hydroxylase-like FAD-dependent oxidoreductase [Dyadobacter sp. BE34]MDR7214898.1 2-polyprenyl-6-methoxyphenol hydroxylase-like FAD-dependent oxidoreductase [Dyadobacter sp. BE3